jgi:hypothetical protein
MTFERQLLLLQANIESVAENESVPGLAGLQLEDTLSSLTLNGRRKVQRLLERAISSTAENERRQAAKHIWLLAEAAWSAPAQR